MRHRGPEEGHLNARFSVESLFALALLAAVITLVAPGVGPVWLVVALYLVCWPSRGEAWARGALIGGAALLLFWAVGRLQVILTPFALALVLAYVLDPSVRRLTALRMPRPVAAVILLVLVSLTFFLVVTVLVPPVVDSLGTIVAGTSGAVEGLWERAYPWAEKTLGSRIDLEQNDYLRLAEWSKRIVGFLAKGATSLGRGVSAAGQSMALLLLTPVVLFYLLADLDRIRGSVLGLLPPAHRGGVVEFLDELNERIAAYFRGQLAVSITAGALTGVLLDVADVPHALSLGVATAVFNLVPVVGFWLGLILAVLAATAGGGALWPRLGWVALIYVGVQQLTDNLLAPRIVGREVGIHPAAMLFSIIFFGTLFGFVGVLTAVPLAVVTRMLSSRVLARYRTTVLATESAPSGAPTPDEPAPPTPRA
ncbi:MAG: AI-2E family transporter [Planctomycetota bacterium]